MKPMLKELIFSSLVSYDKWFLLALQSIGNGPV